MVLIINNTIIIIRGTVFVERKPPPAIDYGLCIKSKQIWQVFLN